MTVARLRWRTFLALESTAKRPLQNSFSPFLGTIVPIRHATHGTQGRANGPKDGPGKRLGAKKGSDEYVVPGNIIFKQRGTKWFPGENVGMGRDHTIFAAQAGFVRFYRDPNLHPKRRYIGVALEKSQMLPTPPGAPRRRRLNMIAVERSPSALPSPGVELGDEAAQRNEIGIMGDLASSGQLAIVQAAAVSPEAGKRALKAAEKRRVSGRMPLDQLQLRPDYSYRESNWQIGRAAERAGVTAKLFNRKDRFLAWRKRTAKKARNAEKRAIGRQKKGMRGTKNI